MQTIDVGAVILTVVVALVAAVALVVSCYRKRDAQHGAIGTVCLSLYDIMTDYLFLFTLMGAASSVGADGSADLGSESAPASSSIDPATLVIVSIASLGGTFVVNVILTAFVLIRERRRTAFAKVSMPMFFFFIFVVLFFCPLQ